MSKHDPSVKAAVRLLSLIDRHRSTTDFTQLFEELKQFSPQLQVIALGVIGKYNDTVYRWAGFTQWSKHNRNLFVPRKEAVDWSNQSKQELN